MDSGAPTIDSPGGEGSPTIGSFDGSHVYADNGNYTVTVTVTNGDLVEASDTLTVVVHNVAPTLTVPPNQTVNEGTLLSLTNIGQFTDPGFDNPLNVGGETTEEFTYAINWGDGTPVQSGAPTIDTPGRQGVPTAGSFDGSHIYADNGVYTVKVTVSDDDGGITTASFQVTVQQRGADAHGGAEPDGQRRSAAVDHQHRPVHRSRVRQPAERRRRDDRGVHLRHQLGRRHAGAVRRADDRRARLARGCRRKVRSTAATSMPTTASTRSRSR